MIASFVFVRCNSRSILSRLHGVPNPGGWLALRVGGARLFGAAVMIALLLTMLTPMATRWNPIALIV